MTVAVQVVVLYHRYASTFPLAIVRTTTAEVLGRHPFHQWWSWPQMTGTSMVGEAPNRWSTG